ncbi:MAG: DHA2 family efflux MFS transporter permease subunit [Dehalococcoidia bacterium]|nr:DHA2 family efflux MFS transporter permease subunit [Dehalococcoidia bacterium]
MTAGLPESILADPSKSPSRLKWVFYILAGLGILMGSIDQTIVAVAIPALTTSLDTSLNWVSWTITGYQLVQIVAMPLAGRMSDAFGRKRVFMFCIGAFTLGSLLCGLAPNIGFLIFFRAVQAIGAGGLMPSAVGIVSDQFSKDKRSQMIGLFTSIFPLGGIIGPNVGGWILQNWSWREIFFINLPIGVVILIGTQLLLHERRKKGQAQRLDAAGLALFTGGMVTIMYLMTSIGDDPGVLRSPSLWVLAVAGVLLFVFFVRQEGRAEQPILDVNLVVKQPFLAANLYNFLYGACVFGFFSFIPYYAVVQYQMSAVQSGVILTPRSIAGMASSFIASVFLIRSGYRLPMLLGTGLGSLSLVLLSFGWGQVTIGPLEVDGFWLTAAIIAISGLGTGMAAPASNNATIDLLPEKAAAITGLRGMFRITGGIMGVSSVVLALSFFGDKAAGMRIIFLAVALIMLVTVPLVFMIPDTARDRSRLRKVEGR